MVKSNQFREQNEIKRETHPLEWSVLQKKLNQHQVQRDTVVSQKHKIQRTSNSHVGRVCQKIQTIPSSKFEDNLIRYCYDVFWLKFTYEITVARIKAQDKYMGRIHFSTVHKPPDLSNSPHSHICKRFFSLLPSLFKAKYLKEYFYCYKIFIYKLTQCSTATPRGLNEIGILCARCHTNI